jgi:pilus assembly protein Flp/PilA
MAERRSIMKELFKSFWADESGQGLTEYALILALVSIALILVLIAFRDEIGRIFNAIRTELNGNAGAINQVPVT